MRPRDEAQYLRDILERIERIESYITDQHTFSSDLLVQDAVIRNLETIGEAATHLSPQTRRELSGIDWNDVVGMRNFLIHGYLFVDPDVVWRTVELDLPELKQALRHFLER